MEFSCRINGVTGNSGRGQLMVSTLVVNLSFYGYGIGMDLDSSVYGESVPDYIVGCCQFNLR